MIGNSFEFYNDGIRLVNLKASLKQTLLEASLYNNESVSFVGVIYEDNAYNIFLPKGFEVDTADNPKDISRTLMNVFIRYKRNHSLSYSLPVGSESSVEEDEKYIGLLTNYRVIIDFYKTRGLYSRHINHKTLYGKGKINWTDTIKQEVPLLTNNGVPVYPRFRSRINKYTEVSSIVQVQKYLTRVADLNIGWLLSGDNKEILFPELANENLDLSQDKDLMLLQLKKEQRQVFDDERSEFLEALINVLEIIDKQALFTQIIGVKHFWAIWEHILKVLFNDQSSDIINRLPIPEYVFQSKSVVSHNRVIPDIVIKKDDGYLILDAKYYDVKKTIPSWFDIIKQSYYRLVIEREFNTRVKLNGFIFPEANWEDPPIEVSINKYNKEQLFDDVLFPKIKCFYISIRKAIEDYTSGSSNTEYTDIIISDSHQVMTD